LEDVERQLLLDDLDVLGDALRRVVREAEDVARIADDAGVLPGEQHLAIFGDLVLPLLRRREIAGVDRLEPDEHAPYAGELRLLDEARILVTEGVDLDDDLEVARRVLDALAHRDDAVEDRLPVLVAGEVVVGDEEPAHALLE